MLRSPNPTRLQPATLQPIPPVEQLSPLVKIAVGLLFFEIFIMFSRFFDVVASGLHIPSVIIVLLLLTSFASGSLFRGLNSPVGRISVSMLAWVSVTMVFSIWRTGSIPIYQIFVSSLLGLLFISGLLSTVRHVQLALYTLAVSSLVASVFGYLFGNFIMGRLEMYQGTFGDPNEYAMTLLMGVPFWWLMGASTQSAVVKVLSMLSLAPIFWAFFNTGSRGGLLALLALLVMLLLQASPAKKMMIIAGTCVSLLVLSATMPSYLKVRYLTFFSVDSAPVTQSEQTYLESDIGSAEGRKNLLKKSVTVTLEHPIFGVGPGNFPVALYSEAVKKGANMGWAVTHNSYTQISSETGIPGMILFVMLIWAAVKETNYVCRQTGPRSKFPRLELYNIGKYLRLSIITVCVCMFFLSMGYNPAIYVLAGIAVSLRRLTDHQIAAQLVSAVHPSPAPVLIGSHPGIPQRSPGRFPSVQTTGPLYSRSRSSN